VSRIVTCAPLLLLSLLVLSCQREQVLSPEDLRDGGAALQRLARNRQLEISEAPIWSGCQGSPTIITLRRIPGYTSAGFSITYDLAICEDGTVTYRGDGCVRVKGMQSAKIDPAEVQKLVQAFFDIDYFGLTDYRWGGTDASGAYTSLTIGERHKYVADYGDVAPQKLKQLENMIDKVAGSDRWINIDAAGVREKVRKGWNIHSPEAAALLFRAAQAGDVDTVRAFIQEGADVNARVDIRDVALCRPPRRVTDSESILDYVNRYIPPSPRKIEITRLLLSAGAVSRYPAD
jgi:hypothetical protein